MSVSRFGAARHVLVEIAHDGTPPRPKRVRYERSSRKCISEINIYLDDDTEFNTGKNWERITKKNQPSTFGLPPRPICI